MAFSGRKLALLAVVGAVLIPALLFVRARGSDHADTPAIAALPGTDLTDVYIFPSPNNANNVVLIMCLHPLITTPNATTTVFDPNVLYQFKVDNTGDFIEDYVIQAKFSGIGANQTVQIATGAPTRKGTVTSFLTPDATTGIVNTPFTTSAGYQVFAGVREDPFFIDLNRFFTILPDRATPITGTPVSNPNTPQAVTWNPPGTAQDFLSANKFNVLSVVVELPKTALTGGGNGKINLWCTTSR